jgi:hypothetical protein
VVRYTAERAGDGWAFSRHRFNKKMVQGDDQAQRLWAQLTAARVY